MVNIHRDRNLACVMGVGGSGVNRERGLIKIFNLKKGAGRGAC